jgi:hypothetical protein
MIHHESFNFIVSTSGLCVCVVFFQMNSLENTLQERAMLILFTCFHQALDIYLHK